MGQAPYLVMTAAGELVRTPSGRPRRFRTMRAAEAYRKKIGAPRWVPVSDDLAEEICRVYRKRGTR